jgi:hypothetical protein
MGSAVAHLHAQQSSSLLLKKNNPRQVWQRVLRHAAIDITADVTLDVKHNIMHQYFSHGL